MSSQFPNVRIGENTKITLEKYFSSVYKQIPVVKINRRVLIYSDIHGNMPALEFASDFSSDQNIKKSLCLGDLIDRNPFNNEVIEYLKDNKSSLVCLAGNHEKPEKLEMKKVAYELNPDDNQLTIENIDWLLSLPELAILEFKNQRILLTHANPWNLHGMYIFPKHVETKDFYLDYLSNLNLNGFMLGHTHKIDFQVKNKAFVVNPGSVGNTRIDGDFLSFCWLLPNENEIHWFRFDHESDEQTKIIKKDPELIKVEKFPN